MLPPRYTGHYWRLDINNKLTIRSFSYQDSNWDDVPLGGYYKLNTFYLNGISALIGDYCLSGDNGYITLDPGKFYIKGTIESSKILPVKFDASKLLDNVLKRNPDSICVANESETSNKFHFFINENGFVCDRLSVDETSSNLCYYRIAGPYIPIYEGFEFRITTPFIERGTQEILITSYTFV